MEVSLPNLENLLDKLEKTKGVIQKDVDCMREYYKSTLYYINFFKISKGNPNHSMYSLYRAIMLASN